MRMIFIWIIFLQELYSLTMSVILVGDPLAIQGQDYKLTCNRSNISPSAQMDWYKDGIKVATLCAPLAGFCRPSQLGGYNFTTDSNGMYIHITGLRRYEDQRQWKCTYIATGSPLEEDTMNLTIFTIPNGLIYTQEPTRGSDLSLSAVTLECVTSSCVYPVPVINWYYKDSSQPGLAAFYKTAGTQTAEANCTSPEIVSSSRLELLQNTTWSDNSNKIVTFSCGIDYSKPLGTVYSKDSFTITFAIRVSWVQMRLNSTTLANTPLVVTSGDPITLSCVSGTSRPDPTIEWFIENERKGSGANFTFIPADTDHDKTIYCQAYNTDPKIPVESAKARMFVRDPPHVIVESINGSYTEKGLLIKCSAHGVPEPYAFRLIHSSFYSGIKLRQLSFDYVSTGTIIYQFASPTYMDTGIYTCTVSNGIPEYEEGSMDKSANGTVWIRDIPRVTSIDRSFYAENGHSGRLVIELFSSLLDPQVMWYKHNSGTLNKLQSSEKYNILLSSTLVSVDFYSVTILQPGYIATLEIKNMTRDDFGSFQVHVENSVGEMSPLILFLKATASEPQDTSHNGPDGALLGGVLGSAVLVSIVVAVVGVILYRRRNKYHDHQSGEESTRNKEHDVVQNRKREEEHYQELEIIAGHVDEKNQTRSAGSPVYQTLTTYDNIREHEYSHIKNASG